jgi:hypothetical protein
MINLLAYNSYKLGTIYKALKVTRTSDDGQKGINMLG